MTQRKGTRSHEIATVRYAPNRWEEHDIPRLPTIQWLETHEGLPSPEKGGYEEYVETWDNGYKKPGDR